MERKNKVANFLASIISQVIILVFGLVVPRIILSNYGSDTNGLINTITQVFTYAALLEAGIGQATRNALYPLLKQKDPNNVSKILCVSKSYYRKCTFIYGFFVLLLAFILPLLLKSSLSYWTIFAVVFFEGAIGVVSFYFVETWSALLQADGKHYINVIFETLYKTLCYIIKIVLAIKAVNIAYIQVGYFLAVLLKILLYYLYFKKNYNWINWHLNTKGEKLADRNSYIVTEFAWTVFSSTDLIVLSVFVSTKLASVYSLYSLVYLSLSNVLNAVFQSLSYILGKSFFSDLEIYKRNHDKFNCIFVGSITSLMCTCYWLILPFISLYTQGVNDINYIYQYLPLLFSLVQVFSWSRYISGNACAFGGYMKQISYVSIIEAVSNVVLSILLVNFYGIYGVTLATVISLPLKVIYSNFIADQKIMKRKPKNTILIFSVNYLYLIITVIVYHFWSFTITSFWMFLGIGVAVFCVYSSLFLLTNFLLFRHLYPKTPQK
jgi:O-antigen/teichoic acid export membrane protein